ncbi:GNAT family N-acetyltransferase [Pseudosulfitobacter pseudonitzschiae]|uniref:GNAT family N-acetyltransferase n=1 Tax=Pseudosulfitobacter pseudonitzschiae TaxID=1402135 RepID=UPI003B7B2B9D
MASSSKVTRICYHGTAPGSPLLGAQDPVSRKVLDVLWVGNTYDLAAQFQDGEVRKLRITLQHPKIITDEDRKRDWPGLGHAFIVDQIRATCGDQYDGVIFPDTIDGMEVGDVYAVFPGVDADGNASLSGRVEHLGSRTYDHEQDEWISDEGFTAPRKGLVCFNFFLADHSVSENYGAIDAYTCSKADMDWSDYFDEMGVRDEMIEAIRHAPAERISVIRDLTIEEHARGEGHGTELLTYALGKFELDKSDIILLFADLEENNDFPLADWYEKHGFMRVDNDRSSPCMMICSDALLSQIRRINGFSRQDAELVPG